jgi:hypothetical protein
MTRKSNFPYMSTQSTHRQDMLMKREKIDMSGDASSDLTRLDTKLDLYLTLN